MPKEIKRWQDLESTISDVLVQDQRTFKIAVHRFFDTKSANTYLPAQPADFMAAYRGTTCLIEAKFSEVHDSLRQCFSNAVSDQQCASARIWNRAGCKYVFLFYSSRAKRAELWDGLYCADQRAYGKPLALPQRRIYTGPGLISVRQAIRKEVGYG